MAIVYLDADQGQGEAFAQLADVQIGSDRYNNLPIMDQQYVIVTKGNLEQVLDYFSKKSSTNNPILTGYLENPEGISQEEKEYLRGYERILSLVYKNFMSNEAAIKNFVFRVDRRLEERYKALLQRFFVNYINRTLNKKEFDVFQISKKSSSLMELFGKEGIDSYVRIGYVPVELEKVVTFQGGDLTLFKRIDLSTLNFENIVFAGLFAYAQEEFLGLLKVIATHPKSYKEGAYTEAVAKVADLVEKLGNQYRRVADKSSALQENIKQLLKVARAVQSHSVRVESAKVFGVEISFKNIQQVKV
jgi:hypothetical protein